MKFDFDPSDKELMKQIKTFWSYVIAISTFLFIWLGWAFPSIRVPLILTYIAFWVACIGVDFVEE